MKKPIVINIFGAPGSGKSTGAAWVFAQLKMFNVNCELITEYAKDKTWEGNHVALDCQEYIFGKQSFRLKRCRDKVDVIVTDSPLPLGIFYNQNPVLDENYENTVMNVFNTYENRNYCLIRTKPYNPIGRNQTQEESDIIGDRIQDFLDNRNIDYTLGTGDVDFYNYILVQTLTELGKFNGKEIETPGIIYLSDFCDG